MSAESADHTHDAPAAGPQRPEFDQANFVADSLSRQNAEQAKRIAILEAAVAERDAFIEANAEVLGLAQPIAPNRQARRAATKRAPRKPAQKES